jgi:predicted DNA-binding WGR domain protein
LDLRSLAVKNREMTAAEFEPIHLHRIDPTRNMARFYRVSIETTLFDETIVRRNWGRIGTGGQSITLVVEEVAQARVIAARLCDATRRRGYMDVSWEC